jgi:hypothetical protein
MQGKMQRGTKMPRKVVYRLLILIVSSWLFPAPAGAGDFGNGFAVGQWGNRVQPCVQVSSQFDRVTAFFYVVIRTSPPAVTQRAENRTPASRESAPSMEETIPSAASAFPDGVREAAYRQNPAVDFGL